MKITESDLAIAPELGVIVAGERSLAFVLNNFYTHFPTVKMKKSERGREVSAGEGFWRSMLKELGWWDELPPEGKRGVASGDYRNSPMRMNQTGKAFYAELDKVAKEVGLTKRQVSVAASEWICLEHTSENIERFGNIILRVYVAMRKKGYTQKDLVC
jgi:hypothetical protein